MAERRSPTRRFWFELAQRRRAGGQHSDGNVKMRPVLLAWPDDDFVVAFIVVKYWIVAVRNPGQGQPVCPDCRCFCPLQMFPQYGSSVASRPTAQSGYLRSGPDRE